MEKLVWSVMMGSVVVCMVVAQVYVAEKEAAELPDMFRNMLYGIGIVAAVGSVLLKPVFKKIPEPHRLIVGPAVAGQGAIFGLVLTLQSGDMVHVLLLGGLSLVTMAVGHRPT